MRCLCLKPLPIPVGFVAVVYFFIAHTPLFPSIVEGKCRMKRQCSFTVRLTESSPLQVTVNTNMTDLNDYLQHILKSTNMKCLTPEKVGGD